MFMQGVGSDKLFRKTLNRKKDLQTSCILKYNLESLPKFQVACTLFSKWFTCDCTQHMMTNY